MTPRVGWLVPRWSGVEFWIVTGILAAIVIALLVLFARVVGLI